MPLPEEKASSARTNRASVSKTDDGGRPTFSKEGIASLESMDYQNPLSFLDEGVRNPLCGPPRVGVLSMGTADDSEATVTLVFDAAKHRVENSENLQQDIIVGACYVGSNGGGGGSFEIKHVDPKDKTDGIWKIGQETGSVKDGKTSNHLVFDKEAYAVTQGNAGNVLASMVGQWVTCELQVLLKGGVIPAGREPQKTISLTLKTYIDVAS